MTTVRRVLAFLFLLVLLPGGLLMTALAWPFVRLFRAGYTGFPQMDRVQMRGAIAFHVLRVFKTGASVEIMRCMMAILHNESAGKPENFLGDNTGGVAAAGPSVGPLQVYRKTARELGLVPDDISPEAYAAYAQKPFTAIGWGVAVFKVKLAAAGGDLTDAVRRYNGGGDAAFAYRDKADEFATGSWGANLSGQAVS